MKNYYVIDRFEGELAVLESMDRKMLPIHVGLLPLDAELGDVICLTIKVDKEKTKEIENEVKELIEELFE